jgi:hypothetical protein
MALFVMANWTAHVIEVRGVFLKGNFEDNELRYLEVQEDFEKHYKEGTVLELKRTIHGLKQAAFAFWKELLIAFKSMGFSFIDSKTFFNIITSPEHTSPPPQHH